MELKIKKIKLEEEIIRTGKFEGKKIDIKDKLAIDSSPLKLGLVGIDEILYENDWVGLRLEIITPETKDIKYFEFYAPFTSYLELLYWDSERI